MKISKLVLLLSFAFIISCGVTLSRVSTLDRFKSDLIKVQNQLDDCIGQPIDSVIVTEIRYLPSDTVFSTDTVKAKIADNSNFLKTFNHVISIPFGEIGIISNVQMSNNILSEYIRLDSRRTYLIDTMKTVTTLKIIPDPQTERELIKLRAILKEKKESEIFSFILKLMAVLVVLYFAVKFIFKRYVR